MTTTINDFEFRQEVDGTPNTRQVIFYGIIDELVNLVSDSVEFTVEINSTDNDGLNLECIANEVSDLAKPTIVDVLFDQPDNDDTIISCRSVRPKPIEVICYRDNSHNLYTLLCYVAGVYTELDESKTKLTISMELIKAAQN